VSRGATTEVGGSAGGAETDQFKRAETTFGAWGQKWLDKQELALRRTSFRVVKSTVNGRLVPQFGDRQIADVSKSEILGYRETLLSTQGGRSGFLSAKRINEIIRTLGSVLYFASEELRLPPPPKLDRLGQGVVMSEIEPFTGSQAQALVDHVDKDWKNYLIVRLFAGLQGGEIDALKWTNVSLERGVIMIRETLSYGESEDVKNDCTERDVEISADVGRAFSDQARLTAHRSEYVFCNRDGGPVDNSNFVKRVWHPLLKRLRLKLRGASNMRHTAAVLWLEQGKTPGWVASQLGYRTSLAVAKLYGNKSGGTSTR
jgi:integrase